MRQSDFGHLSDREILIIVATTQNTIEGRLEDHGKRIRVLERIAGTMIGAAGVIGVIAGWFKVTAGIGK